MWRPEAGVGMSSFIPSPPSFSEMRSLPEHGAHGFGHCTHGSACLHPPELSLWAHTAMPSFDIGAHDSGAHEKQVVFNRNIK